MPYLRIPLERNQSVMQYIAKQSGNIPTEVDTGSGEFYLKKNAIVSVLIVKGKLVCNSIAGFFVVTPETLGLYFRLLGKRGGHQTVVRDPNVSKILRKAK